MYVYKELLQLKIVVYLFKPRPKEMGVSVAD